MAPEAVSQKPPPANPNQVPGTQNLATPPPSPKASVPSEFLSVTMRHGLSHATVGCLLSLPRGASPQQVLQKAASTHHLHHYNMPANERRIYQSINSSPYICWPVKAEMRSTWHKVYLLAQMALSAEVIPLSMSSQRRKEFYGEMKTIFKELGKVLRGLVEIFNIRRDAVGMRNALEVLRSLESGVWDEECRELLQIRNVGRVSAQKLVAAGIRTVKELARTEAVNIERIVSRQPPYGEGLRRTLKQFPLFALDVQQTGRVRGNPRIAVLTAVISLQNEALPTWKGLWLKANFWVERVRDGQLLYFWRGPVAQIPVHKQGLEKIFTADLDAGDEFTFYLVCEEVVGTMVQGALKAA